MVDEIHRRVYTEAVMKHKFFRYCLKRVLELSGRVRRTQRIQSGIRIWTSKFLRIHGKSFAQSMSDLSLHCGTMRVRGYVCLSNQYLMQKSC